MVNNMTKKEVGEVFKYFVEPKVAAINVTSNIKIGDKIHFEGATTDFSMEVKSMEIDREEVEAAKPGDSVGIKVPKRVRDGDKVYLIS